MADPRGRYTVRTIDTLDPTLGADPITVTFPEVKDFQKQIQFAENDVKKGGAQRQQGHSRQGRPDGAP